MTVQRKFRRLLIISPHFPPVNAPDMQRIRMSLPYYRAAGWEPVVLCVGDAWQNGVREPDLLGTVPNDIKIIRSPALSLRWTGLLGVRNLGLRCWWHFLVNGSRIIRSENIDLVFFSNTQFVTFTLGRIWRKLHGVPYVFDMQDPWRTDYYSRAGSRRPPGGWKYQIARASAFFLERWSFARVAGIISVSPNYVTDLAKRYSRVSSIPCAVVAFGASRDDARQAVALKSSPPPRSSNSETIRIVYTGASGPILPHALTYLFGALRRFRSSRPTEARKLVFQFLGTGYVAPGTGSPTVLPVAKQFGVDDQVVEIPHRLGHLECLNLQQRADILLLPGSSDLAYSPSKIYPYFLAERPILALVFPKSVLENILLDLKCAHLFSIRDGNDDAAYQPLVDFLEAASAGAIKVPSTRSNALFDERYLASSLTKSQSRVFDAVVPSPQAAADGR